MKEYGRITVMKRFLDEKVNSKFAFFVFLIIWLLSFIAFINSLILLDWFKITMSFSALVLYFVPFFLSQKFKLKLPAVLEVTFYLFIFAALILGETFAFYGPFPFWDIILHYLSGFLLAGVGLSIVEAAVKKDKTSRFFKILFAFCFSIAVGILWECLEFTFDMTVRTDAQKDAHLKNISTITLQRDGGNRPVRVNDIEKTEIHLKNGETVTIDEGFLDIGLMDTMKDILVNTAGAATFCVFGAFYLKGKTKNPFAKNFMLSK